MEALISSRSELRQRGFQALVDSLGWANAVRFIHQYDPGTGNYTEERRTLLPQWDSATMARKAKELLEERQG